MTQSMHAQMGGAVAGTEELIPAGSVTFGLMYRTGVGAKNDEGICIHVYGNDIPGDDKELLRLDCFKLEPHYHYRNANIKQNERLMLDYTAEGGSVEWALDKIRNRLPVMLLRCGAEETARGFDQREVNAVLPKIVAWAESKTRASYE